MNISTKYLLIVLITFASSFAMGAELSPALIKRIKTGVVTIENSPNKAIYGGLTLHKSFASGSLIDKELGIVLTNSHAANSSVLNNIKVTFSNGQQLTAELLYDDPVCDFAFLKLDASKMPKDAVAIKMSSIDAEVGEQVFIMGNNEGSAFSMQTGTISDKYSNPAGAQSYNISLNTKGGSSGSPVMNYKGEMVALNFAGSNTFAYAVYAQYVIDAFKYVRANQTPPRRSIDAELDYYSLDKAAMYSNFPKEVMINYIKKYPDALNKALVVSQVYQYTPTANPLLPGDLIWQINNQDVGPNLYKFDTAINNSTAPINLTIYRDGVKKVVQLASRNVHEYAIKRFVVFGGAIFYESNEHVGMYTGAKLKSLFVTSVDRQGSFKDLPYALTTVGDSDGSSMVNILSFNNQPVNSLDDLIKAIPHLVKRENFRVEYISFSPSNGFGRRLYEPRLPTFLGIEYRSYGDDPAEFTFNSKTHTWDVKKIQL